MGYRRTSISSIFLIKGRKGLEGYRAAPSRTAFMAPAAQRSPRHHLLIEHRRGWADKGWDREVGPGQDPLRMSTTYTLAARWKLRKQIPRKNGVE